MTRKLFVTTALPYANAPFHIGHMMEYIQADIWVRFQRMVGSEVHFVCADDAHGAPIMIAAEKAGNTPQQFVAEIAAGRKPYLDGFSIAFDNWHSTDAPENHELAKEIYLALRKNELITSKTIEQFFDPVKGMFLPDRYIKGECPKCGAKDQYGDNCEVCGAVYSPTDLKNPYSTLSGAKPVLKHSEHYFFKLSDPRCVEFLQGWTQDGKLQPEVANKVKEWFVKADDGSGGLGDWDISRDAPYFGIEIPDAPGKYFYVWLDAPVGYLASLKHHFDKGGAKARGEERSFDEYLADPAVEQIHFIGKDIVTFHTLFWPAMLKFSGRKVPTHIFVHGFITVSGEKMSKSRGTGISPLRYLELGLNPEWLRYYIAAKLSSKVEDIDFNPDDFAARVNADLVGKYINIGSRIAPFLVRHFENKMPAIRMSLFSGLVPVTADTTGFAMAVGYSTDIRSAFENREFAKAIRLIMEVADAINKEIDGFKPWVLAKDAERVPDAKESLAHICASSIAGFKALTVFLKPILPALATQVETYLRSGPLSWSSMSLPIDSSRFIPQGHEFGKFVPLMQRVDPKLLDALFEPAQIELPPPGGEAIAAQITVDDFAKIDLRIAKIVACEKVDGSTKLLRLTLDVGEGIDAQGKPVTRNVFSGIASAYTPEQLVGKFTVMVANLAPRKMKFGVSEGMVLAASHADEKAHPGLYVLEPWPGAVPGLRVR
ncbi:MAG: methionyl-tRNA synthetase [Methylibium sp. NZG]|nr:MAG: methionyl-tRNA synthetase [Methylibium sp. NZG]